MCERSVTSGAREVLRALLPMVHRPNDGRASATQRHDHPSATG
jgi:hypothetical protein